SPHKDHLPVLVGQLRDLVSDSFKRNREFFQSFSDNIFIISNGFRDFIVPIVTEYGVKAENVLANEFKFDDRGNISGFDENHHFSSNNGKVEELKKLNLTSYVYVILDCNIDFEMKKAVLAKNIYAFTEDEERESIIREADPVSPSLDEILYL